jgi:hypothetical protein
VADWAWHAFDLASGTLLGSIQMASWRHEDKLNAAGSFSGTPLPPEDDGTIDLAEHVRYIFGATRARRAVIVAVRTDDYGITRPEFTGWVPPGGNARPDVAGTSLLGYYNNRVITTSLSFNPLEQCQIPAEIIRTHPGALVDYMSGVVASGMQRTQTWNPWDKKVAGEAMTDIASRIGGFDLDIRTEFDGGQFVRRYRTWYPRRGADFTPRFEYGANMLTAPKPAGNSGYATRVIAVGVETNPTTHQRLVSIQTNTAALAAGEPIVEVAYDRSDITTQQGLDDFAAGMLLQASNDEDDQLTFTIDPYDPNFPWGSWDLGADCWVRFPAGLDLWRPDGLDELRRVVSHRVSVQGGVESFEVTVGRAWSPTA